jgi:hypothetical protein
MSSRANAAAVMEGLEEGTSSSSAVVQSFVSLTSFAQTAGSAAILTTLPGVGHLLAAASVSISAADQVIKGVSQWRSRRNAVPAYDQFRILFYTACHRAYLEALSEKLKKLKQQDDNGDRPTPDYKDLVQHAKEISEAEVTYIICVDPLEVELPLFGAYDRWVSAVLPAYGVSDSQVISLVQEVSNTARIRLKIFLTQQTSDSAWMRDYLALSHQEHATRVLTTLAAVATSLSEWTSRDPAMIKQRYQDAWIGYRQFLVNLPDQRDSMFAETFGVRKVFVAPQGEYRVIGASAKTYLVNNVPRLLGALLSERLPAGELRILCGGPGSGKSTVCRMLASELAKDEAMHPIFLRLRRMKEGADVAAFVEDSLRKEGLIDRLSDLRDLPNLVLILDGFDELVMASRARLRHFFNVLREELTTGPLRAARTIVSGRDTLFPNGDGLPIGAHVLTLAPFDAPRVKAWAKKWRGLHKNGPGSNFTPESLMPDDQIESATPLQHLASWPLTLHLLARAHTKGTLNLGLKKDQDIEKAFLYRSIMADTAQRQTTQTEGQGRFDHSAMQRFLRLLAWEMYSRETDSLDFDDVIPLIQQFYPGATETEATEVTDVAIVNAPELTKGEQTGCEFVHKSFSEYLVGEHIAETVERAAFKAAQFGSVEPTWRMSPSDTTTTLATIFASRLLTPEVQEMFEPMLGCVQSFFSGDSVDTIRSSLTRSDGLARIIERFEMMLGLLSQGKDLELITKAGVEGGMAGTALEAFANYCAGIMIIGTAAARRASKASSELSDQIYFNGEPVAGGFWRCVGLLEAGGLILNNALAARLFEQMSLASTKPSTTVANTGKAAERKTEDFNELSSPLKLDELRRIHGYDPVTTNAIDRLTMSAIALAASCFLVSDRDLTYDEPRRARRAIGGEYEYGRFATEELAEIIRVLRMSGLTSINEPHARMILQQFDRVFMYRLHRSSEDATVSMREYEIMQRIMEFLDRTEGSSNSFAVHFLERINRQWRQNLEQRLSSDQAEPSRTQANSPTVD